MPRKKKTKEAKKKADIRNMAAIPAQTTHEHSMSLYSYTVHHTIQQATTHAAVQADTITLVKKDVMMTAIISSTILLSQLVIYFLLTNHILAIGFVRY